MPNLTLEELIEIFEEVVDLSDVEVNEGSVLGEDIPMDSREMLRVLSRVESRYRIRFAPEDLVGLKTVGNLLSAVRRQSDTT